MTWRTEGCWFRTKIFEACCFFWMATELESFVFRVLDWKEWCHCALCATALRGNHIENKLEWNCVLIKSESKPKPNLNWRIKLPFPTVPKNHSAPKFVKPWSNEQLSWTTLFSWVHSTIQSFTVSNSIDSQFSYCHTFSCSCVDTDSVLACFIKRNCSACMINPFQQLIKLLQLLCSQSDHHPTH